MEGFDGYEAQAGFFVGATFGAEGFGAGGGVAGHLFHFFEALRGGEGLVRERKK